ncbi:MAG: hypothetical protein SFX72_16990 [Isosphaeraceae bacterium]|nr:hypothetical protein [Isosphaeraceae bacterium]
MVSRAFDLIFISSVGWPLLLLPGAIQGRETVVDFWQIYFLTLPHRWITLILVATDSDRRRDLGPVLPALAVGLAVIVIGVRLGTGALTCLAFVDYVWNAWHFAAQHQGILRIYGRKAGLGPLPLERIGLRSFITYVILRTATWSTGWLDEPLRLAGIVPWIDRCAALIPLYLVLSAMRRLGSASGAFLAYLSSVVGLYLCLLWSLATNWASGVIALTTASGFMHASEYLAVVSHYAIRRRKIGSEGPIRRLASSWFPLLGIYAITLGAFGSWAELEASGLRSLWMGVNLWAAFVHYAFDGLIWKLRRPETARALAAIRSPT